MRPTHACEPEGHEAVNERGALRRVRGEGPVGASREPAEGYLPAACITRLRV